MSAPAPANRRSASGSRRFNPLKALQPARRLQQMLASSSPVPVPTPKASVTPAVAVSAPVAIPVPAAPAFDYCRFIELDYVPMETGYMVSMRPTKGYATSKSPTKGYTSTKSPERHCRPTNSPSTPRSRRPAATPSSRDPHGNTSLSSGSNNSSSCRGSDCSPTKGRHQKYTSCTDNHGIRPPPPEQYLTPLQQKEVCIRHLRARLKETADRLQDRDTEIDELRGQLSRMQDDWVEEECHRVEAQLALKEARREIQQLKNAVDTVCQSLSEGAGLSGDAGVQKYFQDINAQNHKLENLLLSMELAQTGLIKEGEGLLGCRMRVGGSAPASVSGESPGGPRSAVGRGSCSCDGSPARSLTRSSTYTKLSDQALADRNGNGPEFPLRLSGEGTQDSGFVCCGEGGIPSRADLLLEAAFLSEETASLLSSYAHSLPHSLPASLPASLPHTYSHTLPHTLPHHASASENLLRCALGGAGSVSHPCLSHHHLYLHHLREQGIQTESCPGPMATGYPADLDTIAEQRTFRSQACSPTSTWMSDEGEEELDSIATTMSVATATLMTETEPIPVSRRPAVPPLPRSATMSCSMEFPLLCGEKEDWGEEENQENEEREREQRGEEEGEVSTVGGGGGGGGEEEGEVGGGEGGWRGVEEAVPGEQEDLEELAAGAQGEAGLGGCRGEGSQAEINLESQAEVEVLVASTQEESQTEVGLDKSQEEVGLLGASTQEESQGEVGLLGASTQEESQAEAASPGVEQPHTSQPRRSTSQEEIAGVIVVTEDLDDDDDGVEQGAAGGGAEESEEGPVQKSYWSRHFLVDLLAVAVPVVPTVAWLCRGPVRTGQPMYHFGSLLRGCCTVALHSLRRGGGLRHYPAGGGDLGGTPI